MLDHNVTKKMRERVSKTEKLGENISLVTESFSDNLLMLYQSKLIDSKQDVYTDNLKVKGKVSESAKILHGLIKANYSNVQLVESVYDSSILADEFFIYVTTWYDDTKIIAFSSKHDIVVSILDVVKENFKLVVEGEIDWFFRTSNGTSSISSKINPTFLPNDYMYPFIKGGIEQYYDAYLKSNATILLLVGPPGTGKTTFLRGLLVNSQERAMVTYDEELLEKDNFFVNFIKSDKRFLIIEDADTLIGTRDAGNHIMAKFLNIGDGLMDIGDKKIIFSTNITDITKIDSALTREGRCFDILNFRGLTGIEAQKLATHLGIEYEASGDDIPVSEVYTAKKNGNRKKKFGFI